MKENVVRWSCHSRHFPTITVVYVSHELSVRQSDPKLQLQGHLGLKSLSLSQGETHKDVFSLFTETHRDVFSLSLSRFTETHKDVFSLFLSSLKHTGMFSLSLSLHWNTQGCSLSLSLFTETHRDVFSLFLSSLKHAGMFSLSRHGRWTRLSS